MPRYQSTTKNWINNNRIEQVTTPGRHGVDSVVAGTNVTVDSTDPHNPIVSSTGGGGGGGGIPTDWVEWEVDSAPQGPYAWNVSPQTVDWVDDLGAFSHGSAIILSGGQPEVTEDGWYVIDTYVLAEASTVGSVWTRGLGILFVNRSFTEGGDAQDNVFLSQVFGPYVDNDGRWGGNASFSWTGYLKAGDSARVRALLSADSDPSDTWQIAEAQFRMEKLPMSGSGGSGVASVVAGTHVTVDNTDPANPIVTSTGVQSVVAGTNVTIDNTDPDNPIVSSSGVGDVTSVDGQTGVVDLSGNYDVLGDAAAAQAAAMTYADGLLAADQVDYTQTLLLMGA